MKTFIKLRELQDDGNNDEVEVASLDCNARATEIICDKSGFLSPCNFNRKRIISHVTTAVLRIHSETSFMILHFICYLIFRDFHVVL